MVTEITVNSELITSLLNDKKFEDYIFIEESLTRKAGYYIDKKIIFQRLSDKKFFSVEAGFTSANNSIYDWKPTAKEVIKKEVFIFV